MLARKAACVLMTQIRRSWDPATTLGSCAAERALAKAARDGTGDAEGRPEIVERRAGLTALLAN